jgi:hypothetical protein
MSQTILAILRKSRAGSSRLYLLLPALFFLTIPAAEARLTSDVTQAGEVGGGAAGE